MFNELNCCWYFTSLGCHVILKHLKLVLHNIFHNNVDYLYSEDVYVLSTPFVSFSFSSNAEIAFPECWLLRIYTLDHIMVPRTFIDYIQTAISSILCSAACASSVKGQVNRTVRVFCVKDRYSVLRGIEKIKPSFA